MPESKLIDLVKYKRAKALASFPLPKPVRKMTVEERESTAEKLRKEEN